MKYDIYDILDVLTEDTRDQIEMLGDNIFSLETADGSRTNKVKTVVDRVSKAYTDGLTKRSNAVANTLIKKPAEGSSQEVQDKYEKKLLLTKAAYKVGEILVSKAVLIGPLDVIATAAIANGIMHSDDPVDKLVASKIKMLTDKAQNLKSKVINLIERNTGKPVTEDGFKKQYEALQLQGLNIAKEMDATKSKMKSGTSVNESVLISKFDEYLIDSNGKLVNNAIEILTTVAESTDYEKYDIFPVIEKYINMIID